MMALAEIEHLLASFVRYASLGVVMNSLGYFLYFCITRFGVEPKIAMTLVYISGVLLNFALSRKWVFEHRGNWGAAFVGYMFAYLLGYIINYGLLWLFVDRVGWSHLVVQAISIVIVAVFLFTFLRLFVFRPPDETKVDRL